MWDSIEQLRSEHGELQLKLADPAVHQSPGLARKLNRRYLELDRIVTTHNTLVSLQDDLAATKELAAEDASFALFLASDESDFFVGQAIPFSGGWVQR